MLDGFVTGLATVQCAVSGCGKPVDFDVNTGAEYAFCRQHRGSAQLPYGSVPMQVQDIEMEDDGLGGKANA